MCAWRLFVHRPDSMVRPILARLFVMDPAVALTRQGGFGTWRALRTEGVTRWALEQAVTSARVVRLRRGVYGLGLPEGADALRAAAITLGAAVSHDSAAVLWGLELAHAPGQHVTVPRNHGRASHAGVVVHRADLPDPLDLVVRDGVRLTSPLRTVLDCAATLPVQLAVVVADSAVRGGLVQLDDLRAAARAATGRNAGRIRRAVALSDPRCGSVLESLLRVLLVLAGLPPDQSQFVIRDQRRRFVARVDFAYLKVRLIVEADGFEFHRERRDYRADRRKANAFTRAGWWLLRFSWEDVVHDPDYVVDAVRHQVTRSRVRRQHPRTQSAA